MLRFYSESEPAEEDDPALEDAVPVEDAAEVADDDDEQAQQQDENKDCANGQHEPNGAPVRSGKAEAAVDSGPVSNGKAEADVADDGDNSADDYQVAWEVSATVHVPRIPVLCFLYCMSASRIWRLPESFSRRKRM